jgi:hypothetical protein
MCHVVTALFDVTVCTGPIITLQVIMGALQAVFAQPVPGLLTNLSSIKLLFLHSIIAKIATEIFKTLVSGILRFYFFNPNFFFLAVKTEYNLGALYCRYFINPN